MRLHRFYIPDTQVNPKEFILTSADQINQIRRVFRLKAGDAVIIFTGTGFDYECKIDEIHDKSILITIVSVRRSAHVPTRELVLCAAVVKKDMFEWITEKATELGVTKVIPIVSERSEKKSLNFARLAKIAVEASEQSGRGTVPEILPIKTLGEAIAALREQTIHQDRAGHVSSIVAFHTEAEKFEREDISHDESLAVFIGPEGGWTADEVSMFHKHDIAVRSLGGQILRAETAVVAALSQVVFG